MISLGAGAPSSAYFPFEEIEVKVSNPPRFAGEVPDSILHLAKYDFQPRISDYGKSMVQNLRLRLLLMHAWFLVLCRSRCRTELWPR
jgi:hypothetical protein